MNELQHHQAPILLSSSTVIVLRIQAHRLERDGILRYCAKCQAYHLREGRRMEELVDGLRRLSQ